MDYSAVKIIELPYPKAVTDESGLIEVAWQLTTATIVLPSLDLDAYAADASSRALRAMERTLVLQGYGDLHDPQVLRDHSVEIRCSSCEWSLRFLVRRGGANEDMGFVMNIFWVIEQSHGPIATIQGVDRPQWRIFPIPPPHLLDAEMAP